MDKKKRIYSLGHEGSNPHIIRSILQENKITSLIDIRRKNNFKNSLFNKYRLQDICRDLEVSYIHDPDLAPSTALSREASQRQRAIRKQFAGRDRATHLKKMTALFDYAKGEFNGRYLEELDQRKACDIFSDYVHRAERCCFFSREKYDHLDFSHRKMLLDHCFMKCKLKARRIDLREWFYRTGQIHNLRKIFERVNRIQFDNQIKRSEVSFSWSHGLASGDKRFQFGKFMAPNLILINQKLDLSVVPGFMVNAILHHELIHYTRYRDGRDFRHTVDFFIDELGFEETGKAFLWERDFWKKHRQEIKEERELDKMKIDKTDPSLKPLFDYIDHIMSEKAKQNGQDQD